MHFIIAQAVEDFLQKQCKTMCKDFERIEDWCNYILLVYLWTSKEKQPNNNIH